MSINSRVQESDPERSNLQMRRGLKLSGSKGYILEPDICHLKLICNYTSINLAATTQTLPRLPVPKLSETLSKYLKSVRPFLNDEELAVTTKLAKEFGSEGGVGYKLQTLLEKRAENSQNWLEEWWLNTAYLENRDPLVVLCNPGSVFPFLKFNGRQDQLKYAARMLLAALDYKELVENDKIPPEMMGKNRLDMSQYKKIFGTCRLPAEIRDKLSYNDSKYIIVIHNNHIFHVDLWGSDDKKLSEHQIVQALEKVMDMSETSTEDAIGILTSENRERWAVAYQTLCKDAKSAASLRDVERSLAVLCLDGTTGLWAAEEGARRSLAAAHTIHGGGSRAYAGNRWFDKTVQFIVSADGVTGLTYEHSPAEGQPVAVLTGYIINYNGQNKTYSESSSSPIEPVRLQFNVNADVKKMIQRARENLDKLASNLELNCFKFDQYGKDFIKSFNMSPDSFLQIAMQYAFYSVHQTPAAQYESAATRIFVGGRTETIRSCSEESVAFSKVMLDAGVALKDKLTSMQRAIKAHKDYTVQAQQGLGVDRHLLGLKLTAMENGITLPKLYSDPGYVRSNHMRMSTSQVKDLGLIIDPTLSWVQHVTEVACKYDGFMCFVPMVADGYAVCYNPGTTDVIFSLAAFVSDPSTCCTRYRAALERALQHMHDVLHQTSPAKL